MPDSMLQGIQEICANRLLADPFFVDVPVLTENLGDIENEIERAIKSLGIVAILVTPTASVQRMKDAPTPYFDRINIVIQVSENVILNRSRAGAKTALDVCEHALTLLHGFIPTGVIEPIYAADPTIALVPDPNGLLTYHVALETHGGIQYNIPKVAAPAISVAGGLATITCATLHAQIFYSTTASTYPSPRSGSFYTGPVSVSPGATIRARAYLAGYIDSVQVSAVA